MLAAKTPIIPQTHHQNPEGKRIPLQPKNIIPSEPTIKLPKPKPIKDNNNHAQISCLTSSNKENNPVFGLPIDASLAEELTAVRKKLERLRLDRDKTEKMLQERTRFLDLQMMQLDQNGEFQKDLEIEVDRLYRLKQLHLSCMRKSPIRSLREKEMEKKSKDDPSEGGKVEESKQELSDEISTTDSPTTSSGSKSVSTSASTSSVTSILRRTSPIPLRLSLESAAEK